MPSYWAAAPGADSLLARALNRAEVTRLVRAVWSERSSTVTALAPDSAATSSASGNGCRSLTDTTPTFRPWERRWGITARTSSVIDPRPTMMKSASSQS